MNNLGILKDHYQREIDKLKHQINTINNPCPLLKEHLNAYVSGFIALGKLQQLNHTDNMKYHYPSLVLYNKEKDCILNSKFI